MAPTAAMLILPHLGETTSPVVPTSPPPEVKASALKWIALGKSFFVRAKSGSISKESKMEVDRCLSADSGLENRFLEAFELSWW
ncbi:hypothetical protein Gotri_027743 [Gossypium trilobum]|uniref:Uncharacterized protein n=1 Tax=Gossypium trilobum TaxID=34281 RepID=A0A7J9FWQ0_9ROSI|nr:hypothetical protein [Gossypium trilobum]